MEEGNKKVRKLKRSRTDVVAAGVFGGMGEYFRIDPVIFRLAGVILFFVSGFLPFIIAYIIAIIIIPEEEIDPNSPIKKTKLNKWWLWLIVIIILLFLLSPIFAFFGFKNYFERFQEFSFIPDSQMTEEYHYTERGPIVDETLPGPERDSVNEYLKDNIITTSRGGNIFAEYHEFGRSTDQLFIWAYIAEVYKENGDLETGTAISTPLVVEFQDNEPTGHRSPRDGSYYNEDIKEMFPDRIYDNVINFLSIHKETLNDLKKAIEQEAMYSL